MKILYGIAKGKKLLIPKGARPLSSSVKEALFEKIKDKIKKSRFLDLFAGSGNVGIEALSRGAWKVTFVDKSSKAVKVIRENLKNCGFLEFAEIIQSDAISIIRTLHNRQCKFDIIFAGPPYKSNFAYEVLKEILNFPILDEDGILIIEHFKKYKLPEISGNLILKSKNIYGDTILSFYKWK